MQKKPEYINTLAFNHWVEGLSPSRITVIFNKLGQPIWLPYSFTSTMTSTFKKIQNSLILIFLAVNRTVIISSLICGVLIFHYLEALLKCLFSFFQIISPSFAFVFYLSIRNYSQLSFGHGRRKLRRLQVFSVFKISVNIRSAFFRKNSSGDSNKLLTEPLYIYKGVQLEVLT